MSPATVRTERATDAERYRALLDARSLALARRGLDGRAGDVARKAFLVCACGTERYGLPLAALAGVLPDRPCTPVPGAPPALRGIIAHAGTIVSVIDLARALGAGDGVPAEDTAAGGHFVRLRAQELPVALAVDRVLGLAEIAADALADIAGGSGGAGLGVAAVSGYCPAEAAAAGDVSEGFSCVDLPALLRPFLP